MALPLRGSPTLPVPCRETSKGEVHGTEVFPIRVSPNSPTLKRSTEIIGKKKKAIYGNP
jgi:hypothetical protein